MLNDAFHKSHARTFGTAAGMMSPGGGPRHHILQVCFAECVFFTGNLFDRAHVRLRRGTASSQEAPRQKLRDVPADGAGLSEEACARPLLHMTES